MKYDLKCKVTPKQEYKTRLKHDDTPDICDIRYDIRYKEDNELDFVQAFVKDYAHVNLIFEIEKNCRGQNV